MFILPVIEFGHVKWTVECVSSSHHVMLCNSVCACLVTLPCRSLKCFWCRTGHSRPRLHTTFRAESARRSSSVHSSSPFVLRTPTLACARRRMSRPAVYVCCPTEHHVYHCSFLIQKQLVWHMFSVFRIKRAVDIFVCIIFIVMITYRVHTVRWKSLKMTQRSSKVLGSCMSSFIVFFSYHNCRQVHHIIL